MKFKYILYTDNGEDYGMDRVVIFDLITRHTDVVRSLQIVPKSAGFINIPDADSSGSIQCYGESTSLKLRARADDAQRIERLGQL